MSCVDIVGKCIFELGCGLGLFSLVLVYCGVDVVVSDYYLLVELFLVYNVGFNDFLVIYYCDLFWELLDMILGWFDLIIGSDVLYECGYGV